MLYPAVITYLLEEPLKKPIMLSAAALLLAGCAAPAATSTVGTATPSASSSAAPAGSAVATDNASSPAAAAPAVAKMSTADTCKNFTTVFAANQPAAGSSDNQKYWETVRDQLRPVSESASDDVKPALDGMISYFDTRAKHWDANAAHHLDASTPPDTGKKGTEAFDGMSKVCSGAKLTSK